MTIWMIFAQDKIDTTRRPILLKAFSTAQKAQEKVDTYNESELSDPYSCIKYFVMEYEVED